LKRYLAITLIGIMIVIQSLASFGDIDEPEATLSDTLEKLIQVEMIQYGAPGVLVGISQNGKTVYSTAMGYSDVSSKEAMNAHNTVVQTGSISKTFTSYALLRAMQQAGLKESDKIERYLPVYIKQAKEELSEMTFGNVLAHTTGITSVKEDTAISQKPSLNPNAIKVINPFSDEALRFYDEYDFKPVIEAGNYSMYSNVNSVIAGMLIEGITHESYESYLSNLLIQSFGMRTSAGILLDHAVEGGHLISGYNIFGGVQTKTRGYQARLLPSDDFMTTLSDMNRFLDFLSDGSQSEIHEALLTRQVQNDALSYGRSNGFGITSIMGYEVYLQDGGIPGINARLLVIPEKHFAMFLAYNADSTAFRESLTKKIIGQMFGEAESKVTANYDEADLNRFIGAYTPMNASDETVEKLTQIIHQVRIVAKDDGLYIGKLKYEPYAQNSFYNEAENKFAVFKVDDLGRLKYLIVDNTLYKRTPFYQSLILEIALLIMTALFNLFSLMVMFTKWQDMRVNRIHDTPRAVILVSTLVASTLIGLILYAAINYNSWDVIFGSMAVNNWIKVFSILGIVLIIPNWMMIQRGNEDFRWTGSMVFVFRVQEILNILLLIWLWRYNLWTF